MFLINYLASTYFRFIKPRDSLSQNDVAVQHEELTALADEEELSSEEQIQLKLVKRIWRRVGMALGVSHPCGVRLAVQKDGLDSSVAMWYQGAPTIVIPRDYLSRLVVPGKQQASHFNAQDWAQWSRFLEESPDQVSDMIAYTHRFSKALPKNKLQNLADRYAQYLNHREFEAELAHEFGHVQARHLNPHRSGRFARWLRRLCHRTLPVCASLLTAVLFFLGRPLGGIEDVLFALSCSALAGLVFRSWLADRLLRSTVSYVRQQWEKEADLIASSSLRFCEGNVRLYKKDILLRIIQEQNVDTVTQKVFLHSEFHPSDGERLNFFVQRLRDFDQVKSIPRPES